MDWKRRQKKQRQKERRRNKNLAAEQESRSPLWERLLTWVVLFPVLIAPIWIAVSLLDSGAGDPEPARVSTKLAPVYAQKTRVRPKVVSAPKPDQERRIQQEKLARHLKELDKQRQVRCNAGPPCPCRFIQHAPHCACPRPARTMVPGKKFVCCVGKKTQY